MKTKTTDFSADWRAATKEITDRIFDVQTFISATITFKAAIGPDDNQTVRIRAVEIKDDTFWQFVKGSESSNQPRHEAIRTLHGLLITHPVETFHVQTADRDLHGRITKKGRVLISHSRRKLNRDPSKTRAHDREKDYPLTRFDSAKLLRVLGIANTDGTIKPSMNAKYRQVNEFLRLLDTTVGELRKMGDRPLRLVDIGCGKAYLSFSAKAHLEATSEITVNLVGIDWNEGVITSCKRMAESMEWTSDVSFLPVNIKDYTPEAPPDIVLSLHACDTATDEAIAFCVEQSASAILCAPCCQHDLQTQLDSTGPNRALLRNGILKERFADVLTDAFRAQILRVMGYRTTVMEFIDPDATARNILIKGIRAKRTGADTSMTEYLDLRDAWKCTPFLAERLATRFPEST